MKGLIVALALALVAALAIPAGREAQAASCAMIRGTGVGVTEGIARWMASKAVTDSAAKWAGTAKHTLGEIKLTCSTFSCQGAAKACKK